MDAEPLRLSKLMTQRGICSRREADDYISKGLVFVDGEKITKLGTKVLPDCKIELASKARQSQKEKVTILLNKPVGYVSSQPEKGYIPAVDLLVPERQDPDCDGPYLELHHLNKLAVAGRLDIDSKGLLVFSQDGRVVKQLIGEGRMVDKEYLVWVKGDLSEDDMNLLRHGLVLDGKALKPAEVEWINESQLRFVLREGKKRQIRHMCEAVGLKVTGLKRVRIGKVRLAKLPEGKWRWLRPGESFE